MQNNRAFYIAITAMGLALVVAAAFCLAVTQGWFRGAAGPQGEQGPPGPTAEVPVQPTEALVPTDEPASGEAVAECPQAKDLGPWAPNNGVGEDFEVTANETVSAGVHVQLWWPAGSGQDWGDKEISVFLPPGLSIEVLAGAGKGWEYALTCAMSEIQSQMDADHLRRQTDTAYYGVVDVDDLIDTGLVVVRFDRR